MPEYQCETNKHYKDMQTIKVTKKDQVREYAAWLWPGVNAQVCNVVAGGAYHIGIVTEEGSVEKQLTPCYKTIPELLAYLQGFHAAKQL